MRGFYLYIPISFFFFYLIGLSVKAKDLKTTRDTATFVASQGYNDIVQYYGKLYAVGTDGRIDCISKSGEKVIVENSNRSKLNCAFSNEEILIAAGENGTILYSTNGKNFFRAEPRIDKNIHGITSKKNLIIACADDGAILISRDGKFWTKEKIKTQGNIISISANNTFFIGITDESEIIKSFDGINWEIKNYNQEYAGYNKYSKFKKILAIQNSIVIIGTHDDGSPSILFSSLGNVWAERIPVFRDERGMDCLLEKEPNAITYDFDRDQFVIACNDGELLSLPSCNKCNEHRKIATTNLNSIIYTDGDLLIVSSGYSFFLQKGF